MIRECRSQRQQNCWQAADAIVTKIKSPTSFAKKTAIRGNGPSVGQRAALREFRQHSQQRGWLPFEHSFKVTEIKHPYVEPKEEDNEDIASSAQTMFAAIFEANKKGEDEVRKRFEAARADRLILVASQKATAMAAAGVDSCMAALVMAEEMIRESASRIDYATRDALDTAHEAVADVMHSIRRAHAAMKRAAAHFVKEENNPEGQHTQNADFEVHRTLRTDPADMMEALVFGRAPLGSVVAESYFPTKFQAMVEHRKAIHTPKWSRKRTEQMRQRLQRFYFSEQEVLALRHFFAEAGGWGRGRAGPWTHKGGWADPKRCVCSRDTVFGLTVVKPPRNGNYDHLGNGVKANGSPKAGGRRKDAPVPPSSFGAVSHLHLQHNNLCGWISSELRSFKHLCSLDLSRNHLFTGFSAHSSDYDEHHIADYTTGISDATRDRLRLPTDLFTSLKALERCLLNDNHLSGPLPSFAGLLELHDLDLSNNQFEGQVPPFVQLFEGCNKLVRVDLSHNKLRGRPFMAMEGADCGGYGQEEEEQQQQQQQQQQQWDGVQWGQQRPQQMHGRRSDKGRGNKGISAYSQMKAGTKGLRTLASTRAAAKDVWASARPHSANATSSPAALGHAVAAEGNGYTIQPRTIITQSATATAASMVRQQRQQTRSLSLSSAQQTHQVQAWGQQRPSTAGSYATKARSKFGSARIKVGQLDPPSPSQAPKPILLPSPFGASANTLVCLCLSHNRFEGQLPSMLSMLELERLDFSHNCFDGPLPQYGGCKSLRALDLSCNQLDSILPNEAGLQQAKTAAEAAAIALVKGDLKTQYPRLRRIDLRENKLPGPERAAIARRFGQLVRME
jgi:Leucine-rich repeat (LRR) protein